MDWKKIFLGFTIVLLAFFITLFSAEFFANLLPAGGFIGVFLSTSPILIPAGILLRVLKLNWQEIAVSILLPNALLVCLISYLNSLNNLLGIAWLGTVFVILPLLLGIVLFEFGSRLKKL